MTAADARFLTSEVKRQASTLWESLLKVYEGQAHRSLGYSILAAYCAAEFDTSDVTAYRMLQAARMVEQLPNGSQKPSSESQMRELLPLKDARETMREALQMPNGRATGRLPLSPP